MRFPFNCALEHYYLLTYYVVAEWELFDSSVETQSVSWVT